MRRRLVAVVIPLAPLGFLAYVVAAAAELGVWLLCAWWFSR